MKIFNIFIFLAFFQFSLVSSPIQATESETSCLVRLKAAFPSICKSEDINIFRPPNAINLYGYKFSSPIYFVPRLIRGGRHIDIQTALPTKEFFCHKDTVKSAKIKSYNIFFCDLNHNKKPWKFCIYPSDATKNYKGRDGLLKFGMDAVNNGIGRPCQSLHNAHAKPRSIPITEVELVDRKADFQMTSSQESISTFCRLLGVEASSKCAIKRLKSESDSTSKALEDIFERIEQLESE